MAKLSASTRAGLHSSEFAVPGKRAYPIPDENHARLALAMVSKYGTPAEKAQVHAAVHSKFPAIGATDALKAHIEAM